ncbi:Era Like 12S Mitochondrial RRNA Chaperone 1 [Haplosporangium sp. Z 767]|nr:Era Like 12S Mitochondrial RRNA Chaperone 1 [Haplosporangium sp. Z 767]KAF9193012.1 Era Like 12S Mitochondrial RRNA Chaperone 1 [Haplosporangium sp. Z 11]
MSRRLSFFKFACCARISTNVPSQALVIPYRSLGQTQRHYATKRGKSSTQEGMAPTAQSLELLKRALYEKRAKLKEITERQAAVQATIIKEQEATSITTLPTAITESQDTIHSESQENRPSNRSMPIFASPADMTVRLPKVVVDFDQPPNSEIVKIALIGSPNVGKSTIVNDLVKSIVSIVSLRPHTTRERVRAVLTQNNKQIVFYDTPGVVPEKNVSRLNRELVTASWKALEDADHLLVVMDCNKLLNHGTVTESYIFQRLAKLEKAIPATLIFNKMDLVKNHDDKIQELTETYNNQYPHFVKTIYTSAQTPKVGIQELRSHLLSLTQPGPWLYPATQKTDQSELSRVEDMIRSELYELLKLPYAVKQVNVGWTELEDNVLRIDQNLIVDRPGMKKIIVGSNGTVIRDLTMKARQNIGRALERRIMLNLQVKVKPSRA